MEDNEFYDAIAEILGTTHTGVRPMFPHKKRWYNREPGRGRYPGYGIVRVFGSDVHMSFNAPVVFSAIVKGKSAAVDLLRNKLQDK